MKTTAYQASDWGTLYHNLPFEEALGAGSAGPGKTEVLLHDPLPQVYVEHQRCENKSHPYHQSWGESTGWALHLRRTVKNLEQSIGRTHRFIPQLDPGAKWIEAKNMWVLSSGYKFQFGHCKDKNSWMDYFSSEYTHLAFDELVTFEEEQYRQISTRVRSGDPVLSTMLKTRAMSNPSMTMDAEDTFAVTDPHWVRRYFVDPAPQGKVILERKIDMDDGTSETWRRMYLPATIDDNPNKLFVKQYKIRLSAQPKHIREALLYGNWYYTPGSYYGEEWNERIHTCLPFKIPVDWPIFRSMDWGYKHHGIIHWWAMDDDGNLYCIRELTFIGKEDIEVAKMVKEIEQQMGLWRNGRSAITGPADTQLWEQRGNHGRGMAANFELKGVHWMKCDKGKTQQRNAERLLARLKDHKDGTVTPGIVIFRTCPNLIKSLPMIQADPKHPYLPRDTGDQSHAHDSCLYSVAYASRGKKGIAKIRRSREKWEDEEKKSPRTQTGNYGSVA